MIASDYDSTGITAPRRMEAVTPHATNALPGGTADALYVGGGGNLTVKVEDSSADVTLAGLSAGQWVPGRFTHVRATSTATSIVAMYCKKN